MSKKSTNSLHVDFDPPLYDHTELEEFLENSNDIEIYFRDGASNYLVIEKAFYSMGGPDRANNAIIIKEKFPYYNITMFPQPGHSGFIWRRVYRLTGGKMLDISENSSYIQPLGKLYLAGSNEELTINQALEKNIM